jgi:hypothetical protein
LSRGENARILTVSASRAGVADASMIGKTMCTRCSHSGLGLGRQWLLGPERHAGLALVGGVNSLPEARVIGASKAPCWAAGSSAKTSSPARARPCRQPHEQRRLVDHPGARGVDEQHAGS